MTPVKETTCMHCGVAAGSDLSWKIPVIIAMFVAAFILSLVIAIFGG